MTALALLIRISYNAVALIVRVDVATAVVDAATVRGGGIALLIPILKVEADEFGRRDRSAPRMTRPHLRR